MATLVRAGIDKGQEPGTPFRSLTWLRGAPALGPSSTAFLGTLTGSQIGRRAARTGTGDHMGC